jgi:hypothetical protein
MKWLFLGVAAIIFLESAKAYMLLGSSLMGGLGRIGALLVFLIVQGMELRPIVMTGGAMGIIPKLGNIVGGRQVKLNLADPEELIDATQWATRAYAVDFVAGLFVWPPISGNAWALLRVGGVSISSLNGKHAVMIMACVFALQFCVQQYLVRGGKVPKFLGGLPNANA